jgi:hypothetical protein
MYVVASYGKFWRIFSLQKSEYSFCQNIFHKMTKICQPKEEEEGKLGNWVPGLLLHKPFDTIPNASLALYICVM